jgi:hypothetical protein
VPAYRLPRQGPTHPLAVGRAEWVGRLRRDPASRGLPGHVQRSP